MEETLSQLHCPFTWKIPKELLERLNFIQKPNYEEQSEFLINGFCYYLMECYERVRKDEIEVAIVKANECESELLEYLPVGRYAECDSYLWERSIDALKHILFSTQAYIAYLNDDYETAEMKISQVIPIESLEDSGAAVVWGIRSKIYQCYGFSSLGENAIECARKAVQLDPTVPLWHFLLGKSLARQRRNYSSYDPPCKEEINELSLAWKKCKKPDAGVMLLQSYQALYKHKNNKAIKELILETIADIKKYASDEWYIYWRCAHVCVRLPIDTVPKEEIKEIINSAFLFSEKSHNENKKHLFEVQASYYYFIEKDLERALKYYTLAADAGDPTCAYQVFNLSYKLHKEEDLLPIIEKYIELYHGYDDKFLPIKASYLLFRKDKVTEALEIYLNVMSNDCKSYHLLKCRPLFEEYFCHYNTYTLLKKTLMSKLKNTTSVEEKIQYRDYLRQISSYEKFSKQ